MIKDFKCKETALIWQGEVLRRLPRDIQQVARRKRDLSLIVNLIGHISANEANANLKRRRRKRN